MKQHLETITNLLLGAAYSDKRLEGHEVETIRRILGGISGDAREDQIKTFNPAKFDAAAAASQLGGLSGDEKQKLLGFIATVNESDEVLDLDEDAYLRKVATGLGLSDAEIKELTLEVDEDEDWSEFFEE